MWTFLGKPISVKHKDVDPMKEYLLKCGIPLWAVESLLEIYNFQNEGSGYDVVTNDIERVLGRKSQSFYEFLSTQVELLGGKVCTLALQLCLCVLFNY